jgi:hypothetical protein
MRLSTIGVALVSSLLLLPGGVVAQPASGADVSVPRVMQFNGTFHPANGQPPAPIEIVTFAIYADETGGTALWQETQNVTIASGGDYTVALGSTNPAGLPMDVFASGQAHWLGVQVNRQGETEQSRIRIMSVPYALRSADADTLGGKPASAYVLAEPTTSTSTAASGKPASATSDRQLTTQGATTQSAATGYIPVATDSVGGLGNSVMFQSASNFIGVGTTTPNDAVHAVVNDPNGNFTGYAVQNKSGGAAAYSGMLFYDQNGALTQFQGFNNSTHEYRINNIASGGTINFMAGGASRLLVANNGGIGLGAVPGLTDKLHVAGNTTVDGNVQTNGQLQVLSAAQNGLRVQTNVSGGFVGSFGGFGTFNVDAPGIVGGRLAVLENGNVGIGIPVPGQKLTVGGTVQSTAGGFMFPDGSVQGSAAKAPSAVYTKFAQPEIALPAHLIHLDLAPGTYLLWATSTFVNNANFFGADNNRFLICGFSGTNWSEKVYDLIMPGDSRTTYTFHSVVTITSGGADLECDSEFNPSNVLNEWTRITALKIEGTVTVE